MTDSVGELLEDRCVFVPVPVFAAVSVLCLRARHDLSTPLTALPQGTLSGVPQSECLGSGSGSEVTPDGLIMHDGCVI